ncbi:MULTISPECIES: DcaP family trimeric outer membrane transporter [unclassified Acinetobacter]|uniref:DcaP family trimeric outer membrane transporter n=1 Tax=unclassified Acinetobacter TaxID=196816 RepID=UPI00190E1909|nr:MULTISPECIES: DcaP family trimeric outer membrane transporter [unclassified Acinetobacter]MBK0063236.1 carbohydrate porin [Acinetobacter sp. S55]MBK0066852.1 carbohydrate porin [Acinetobacter sp. S54]
MKKLMLAVACATASGALFANSTDTTEQRINALENELQRLKAELNAQKNTQQDLQVKQQKIEENTEKLKTSTWTDNVDFYGILRMDAAVDFKSAPTARGRTSGKINAAPYDANNHTRSDVSIAATRFGVNIKNLGGNDKVQAKLEGDFWANGGKGEGAFRVRHAYVTFDNWLFGQTWSLMSNMETATESVDFTQLLGISYTRLPQIRYEWKFNPQHTLDVAAEYTSDRTSALPSLTAKYLYKQDGLLALAQGFVNEKEAEIDNDQLKKTSWGVGAGFKYRFNPKQSVQANYFHIKGDQKFVPYSTQGSTSDGSAWGGDYSVNTDQSSLLLSEYDTFTLGYSHRFNESWRSSIAASIFNYDDDNAYAKANPTANKRLTDYVINAFYTPTNNVDLGLEYHHGKRESFDDKEADISRINFVSMYKF